MSDSVFRALGWLSPMAVALLFVAGPPPSASADTPSASQPPSFAPNPFGGARDPSLGSFVGAVEASAGLGGDGLRDSWWRDHVVLRLRGLEYRDDFVFRNQSLRLRLRGPFVKGAPGLRMELQGWSVRGTSASFSAYGSAKRQGFRLKFEF